MILRPLFQWRPIGGEKQAMGANPPSDIASGRITEVRS